MLQTCVLEVLGSNLCRYTGHPYWGFTWFTSVSAGKYQDSISITPRPVCSKLLLIYLLYGIQPAILKAIFPPKFNIFVSILELGNLWKRRSWRRKAYKCSLTAICFSLYLKTLHSWWYSRFHMVNLILNRNAQVRLVCTRIIDFPIPLLLKKWGERERKCLSEPNVKYS